jgi:hypothetical protein
MRSSFQILLLTTLCLAVALCPVIPNAYAQDDPRLRSAASSPAELAERFLDAIAEGDLAAARRLLLTFDEYERYIWPELPEADPARNLNPAFVWEMTSIRGDAKLRGVIGNLGGRRLELEQLEFTGGVQQFPGFRLHRSSRLQLRDETGELQSVRLFGSVVERDGQFRIFSFNFD